MSENPRSSATMSRKLGRFGRSGTLAFWLHDFRRGRADLLALEGVRDLRLALLVQWETPHQKCREKMPRGRPEGENQAERVERARVVGHAKLGTKAEGADQQQ